MSTTFLDGLELEESMKCEKHHQHQHEMPLLMSIILILQLQERGCRTLKWMSSSKLVDFK